ncbi:MAG: hypothetical protein K2R93_16605 [Gemmatimonadaceae bacterium]|nr:hypothetical protein [Gemmatimonadaceae bacterium]
MRFPRFAFVATLLGVQQQLHAQTSMTLTEARVQGSCAAGNRDCHALQRREGTWYVNQPLRDPLVYTFEPAADKRCDEYAVRFQPLGSTRGTDQPDAVLLMFAENANPSGEVRECRASWRWRLSDYPGKQYVEARLYLADKYSVGTPPLARATASADANSPAQLFVGMAWDVQGKRPANRDGFTPNPQLTKRFLPTIGADVPLIFPGFAVPRVRVVVATAFNNAGADLYGGVSVVPLFLGARAGAFPMQVMAAMRWYGPRADPSIVIGGFVTSAGLTAALQGLGIR